MADRLPEFDKGLVVGAPHGDRIGAGRETALVRGRRYHLEGLTLLVIQGGLALGTVRLAPPRAIDLAALRATRARHLVSEEERRRLWPRKTAFFMYEIQEFRGLERPVAVGAARGRARA